MGAPDQVYTLQLVVNCNDPCTRFMGGYYYR
jgi:hypothetical protein